jgi:DnaJ family protein A protein 2
MKNGQQISFAGEGDQAPNIIPGDIIIALNQKPHSTFRRDGDDLIYQANIDLLTALAGGQFAIPHLDDRMLLVTILPGEAIQPDMVKVIPNEGMPSYRHQTHGHLFVKFTVDFPQSNWADDETIAQLRAILPPSKPLPAFGNKHVDEVVLADATGHQSQRAHHAHHNDDDDDDEQDRGPPGVQCAQS